MKVLTPPLALALLSLGLGACAAARADSKPEPAERPVVELESVRTRDEDRPLRVAGLVAPSRELSLGFKVGGVVSQVRVDVGSKVRKGDVLALVDASEFSAGALQAEEGVKKAERDLERVRGLHERGTVPLADVQNAETAVRVAKAALSGVQVNVARAALIAPQDGVIDMRAIEPGEVVPGGKPVFRMSGTSGGYVVRVGVTDKDVATLRLGMPCTARLDANLEREEPCEVTEIATAAAPMTGLFDVEVRLQKAIAAARTGAVAKVQIARIESAVSSVPISALVDGRDRDAAVYSVVDGIATRRSVRVRYLAGDRAFLEANLDAPNVVARGAGRLRDGLAVSTLAPTVTAPQK
jgi:RND family efflux transporter MFP subunit